MLISSHRINEVSALVNRVVELDMGKIVLDEAIANEASLAGLCTARVSCRQVNRPWPRPWPSGTFVRWTRPARVGEGQVAGPDRLHSWAPFHAMWP